MFMDSAEFPIDCLIARAWGQLCLYHLFLWSGIYTSKSAAVSYSVTA
jgi:hypothetical protein